MAKETTENPSGKQYWTVLFSDDQTGGRAMRMTPNGGLTRLKMYAAMFADKEYAEKIAREVRAQNPNAKVRVEKF